MHGWLFWKTERGYHASSFSMCMHVIVMESRAKYVGRVTLYFVVVVVVVVDVWVTCPLGTLCKPRNTRVHDSSFFSEMPTQAMHMRPCGLFSGLTLNSWQQ
jgi:hypothetical protein